MCQNSGTTTLVSQQNFKSTSLFKPSTRTYLNLDKLLPYHQFKVFTQLHHLLFPTTSGNGKTKSATGLYIWVTIYSKLQHRLLKRFKKCKSIRKSVIKTAKAAITKLAPGAFSPKQQGPATEPHSPPQSSSSSSWNFWPSKWIRPEQCQIRNQHCMIPNTWNLKNSNCTSDLPENTSLDTLHPHLGTFQLHRPSRNTLQDLPPQWQIHLHLAWAFQNTDEANCQGQLLMFIRQN